MVEKYQKDEKAIADGVLLGDADTNEFTITLNRDGCISESASQNKEHLR